MTAAVVWSVCVDHGSPWIPRTVSTEQPGMQETGTGHAASGAPVRVAGRALLEQFQRLACGVSRDALGHPLTVLERVHFDGWRVDATHTAHLVEDLERGIAAIASIDTPAWRVIRNGRAAERLVVHERGVGIARGPWGSVVLAPDGLYFEAWDGTRSRIDLLTHQRAYRIDGGIIGVDHAPHNLTVRAEPVAAEAPFVPAVRRWSDLATTGVRTGRDFVLYTTR